MGFRLVVVGLVIAVGVIATVLAVRAREADPEFVQQQRRLPSLSARAVEAVVRTAPVLNGRPGQRARCRPGGRGELRNPWRCGIAYPSGRVFRFVVTVLPNGSYVGRPAGVPGGTITGCCIGVPASG